MERKIRTSHLEDWLRYHYRVRGKDKVDNDELLEAIEVMPDDLIGFLAEINVGSRADLDFLNGDLDAPWVAIKGKARRVQNDRADETLLGNKKSS